MKRHVVVKQGYLDFCVACGASRPNYEAPWHLNEERQPWCPGGRIALADMPWGYGPSDTQILTKFKTWLTKTDAIHSLRLLIAALEELEIPDRNDVWGSEGPDN